DTRFDQFARGELTVQDVLSQPDDLAVYALATLLEDRANDTDAMLGLGAVRQLPTPGELGSRSSLPIGAGMGSSAAIVAAITILFENLLNRSKTPEERLDRVRWCERLKHGKAGPIKTSRLRSTGFCKSAAAGGWPRRFGSSKRSHRSRPRRCGSPSGSLRKTRPLAAPRDWRPQAMEPPQLLPAPAVHP
ncbi:MAG: hypothetical protein AAF589_08405, partial [Planctomycetota bacterium]